MVVAVVLSVGGFAAMWLTRPAADKELVDLAKSRQLQPLMQVEKPARLQKTVDQENKELVDELYPFISEKIIADQKVTDNIISQFNATLEEKVSSAVEAKVNDLVDAKLAVYEKGMRDEFEMRLADARQAITQQLVDNQTETIDKTRTQLKKELDEYLPQAVDSLIPTLVPLLVDEFVKNQDTYVPALQKMLEPYQQINEEQALALYQKYRNDIIVDLVPILLDNVQAEMQPILDDYVGLVPVMATTPTATAPVVPAAPTTVTSTQTAVPAAPAEVKATENKQTVITPPSFLENAVTTMTSEEYNARRAEIRKQQIQQVLERIDGGK